MTHCIGQAWIAVRSCIDQCLMRRAQTPADRWLAWQQLSTDRFQGNVQHREAESGGREGK